MENSYLLLAVNYVRSFCKQPHAQNHKRYNSPPSVELSLFIFQPFYFLAQEYRFSGSTKTSVFLELVEQTSEESVRKRKTCLLIVEKK